jgi:hypothetical protein
MFCFDQMHSSVTFSSCFFDLLLRLTWLKSIFILLHCFCHTGHKLLIEFSMFTYLNFNLIFITISDSHCWDSDKISHAQTVCSLLLKHISSDQLSRWHLLDWQQSQNFSVNEINRFRLSIYWHAFLFFQTV